MITPHHSDLWLIVVYLKILQIDVPSSASTIVYLFPNRASTPKGTSSPSPFGKSLLVPYRKTIVFATSGNWCARYAIPDLNL